MPGTAKAWSIENWGATMRHWPPSTRLWPWILPTPPHAAVGPRCSAALGRYLDALDEFDKTLVLERLGRLDLATQVCAQAQAAAAEGLGAEQQETAEEQRDQEQMSQ